jgi:hypothetical protein
VAKSGMNIQVRRSFKFSVSREGEEVVYREGAEDAKGRRERL